jgi:hypothetical protein
MLKNGKCAFLDPVRLPAMRKTGGEEMKIKEVRREAKKLNLTVKTKSNSFGISGTIHDNLSSNSTNSSCFNGKDPEVVNFLERLAKLTVFIDGRNITRDSEKVYGI